MAQSGRAGRRLPRQLSGVKRTRHFDRAAAANDPKRTFATVNYCIAKGLFDHLVGDGEHVLRHFDAKRSRRLQVDDKLEFG